MTECPNCGSSDVGDVWCAGRMLRHHCYNCDWGDTPRIPEQKEVAATKQVAANQFCGYCFEIFDKYGHAKVLSRAYRHEEDALRDLEGELRSTVAGAPFTGVLWPATVEVQGKMFKLADGKLQQVAAETS